MTLMCFVHLAGSRFYDKNGIAFSEHVCFLRLISVALFFFLFLSFGVCERRRKEYLFAFLCSVSLGPKKLEPAIHLQSRAWMSCLSCLSVASLEYSLTVLSLFYVASTFHKSDLLGVVAQIPLYSVDTCKHMHHIELNLHTIKHTHLYPIFGAFSGDQPLWT
jgi:hypothetical protein